MRFYKNLSFFLASVLLTLGFISCENQNKESTSPVRNVILVDVETSGENDVTQYAGVIKENKSVNAAFMTGGKLASMIVKEGDKVRKGQLLATIEDTDYKIGVNQLKVQYDQMTAEKKRMDEMYARHNIAHNDYEKFKAGYEQLGLQLEMAQNKLDYTKLYSPTDGFISYKYHSPGELVDAGTPIYKISDDTRLEVEADLPPGIYLNRGEIKEAIGRIGVSTPDIPLKIESFAPDADNNQLYHLRLSIPPSYNSSITPGMNVTVMIKMNGEANGETLIPSRAIFDEDGLQYVWIFNAADSTITKKNISVVGQPEGGNSYVEGLEGNHRIVATGVKQLVEGEKVNVVSNPVTTK